MPLISLMRLTEEIKIYRLNPGSKQLLFWLSETEHLYFDIKGNNGGIVNWYCELRPATAIRTAEWRKTLFPASDKITIMGR